MLAENQIEPGVETRPRDNRQRSRAAFESSRQIASNPDPLQQLIVNDGVIQPYEDRGSKVRSTTISNQPIEPTQTAQNGPRDGDDPAITASQPSRNPGYAYDPDSSVNATQPRDQDTYTAPSSNDNRRNNGGAGPLPPANVIPVSRPKRTEQSAAIYAVAHQATQPAPQAARNGPRYGDDPAITASQPSRNPAPQAAQSGISNAVFDIAALNQPLLSDGANGQSAQADNLICSHY